MPEPTVPGHPRETIVVGLRKGFASYDFVLPRLPTWHEASGTDRERPALPDYQAWLARVARRLAQTGPDPRQDPATAGQPLAASTLADNMPDMSLHRHGPAGAPPSAEQALWILGRHAVRKQMALVDARGRHDTPEHGPSPGPRRLSEIATLRLHPDRSMPVGKCIYPRLPLSLRDAASERAFLVWARDDTGVQALGRTCHRHRFMRLANGDGGPRYAMPDFLVRTPAATYLVDVHARRNPMHRLRAMMNWCEWTNALPAPRRGEQDWFFAPLAGLPLQDWHRHGDRLGELLAFARVRATYGAGFGSLPRP